jgi:hypothetical protein
MEWADRAVASDFRRRVAHMAQDGVIRIPLPRRFVGGQRGGKVDASR